MSTPPPIRYQDKAPRPPDGALALDDLLAGDGPLEIDIGFGRGMSLFERAAASPGTRLLGIEIKSKLSYVVDRRRQDKGLDQVLVWCGDAKEILSRSGPDGCVERVFVHFPDPWWKKRHDKRRVIGDQLLEDIGRLLRRGGELFVQTDVEDRALSYRQLLVEHPDFELSEEDGWLQENPFGSRSNRQRRADADGLPVYRILAVRR